MNETAERTPQALLDEATRYLRFAERTTDPALAANNALIGIGYALAALAETLQAVMVNTTWPTPTDPEPAPAWALRVADVWTP